METILNKSRIYIDKSKTKSILLTIYLVFQYILIYLGLFSIIPTIISYIMNAIIIMFLDKDEIFYFLVGLAPFAGIYNFGPGASSLFTFLFLESNIILFIKQEKNDFNVYILIFTFAIFVFLRFAFDYQNIIKLVCNLLLIYFFVSNSIDVKKLLFFFTFGLLSSSILGFYKETIPELAQYYSDFNYYSLSGKARFSGLMQDPNYYTIALFVVLFTSLLLYYNNVINIIFWIIFLIFSSFGFLTVSKSFILMYIIFIIILFTILIKKRKKIQLIFFLILIGIFLTLSLSGKINILNLFYKRLFETNNTTFLTGRDLIWKEYLEFFKQNPLYLITGVNPKLGLVDNRSAHNLYIEMIYHLGIIGSLLLINVFVYVFVTYKKINRYKILNYVPLFVILSMAFFLSLLFNYLFSIYIIFIYSLLNLKLNSGGNPNA